MTRSDITTDFVISDLHLEHSNIIKHCNRPFETAEQMDKTIINNWNKTVKKGDVVIFLGDLTVKHQNYNRHLKNLNGVKRLVKGNHDHLPVDRIPHCIMETVLGVELLFIHDPAGVPDDYNGWVIHGHVHRNGPFIDPKKKRVNVSAEVVNYTPVSLLKIIKMIKKAELCSKN